MGISETIKTELHGLCQKIARLIGLKHGSVEKHCFHGELERQPGFIPLRMGSGFFYEVSNEHRQKIE